MKKVIALGMAIMLALGTVACGGTNKKDTNRKDQTLIKDTENFMTDKDNMVEKDTMADDGIPGASVGLENDTQETPGEVVETVGQGLVSDFLAGVSEDISMTTADIARNLSTGNRLGFKKEPVSVKEGKLKGFADKEITGFDEATMFEADDENVPFVGYVFRLPEDADVESFMDNLKTSGDPAWIDGQTADEVLVEHHGQDVLFIMSPKSLDNAMGDEPVVEEGR